VRTLPAVLTFASDEVLGRHVETIREHVTFVWTRLAPDNPAAQGIAEAAPDAFEARARAEQASPPEPSTTEERAAAQTHPTPSIPIGRSDS
jgi:hypothetical protein